MAAVHLPRSLAALFPDAPRRLEVEADDVAALIRALDARYPGMWDRLCAPGPVIREHINVFVDGTRAGIQDPLSGESVVHIIPAVSGGDDDVPRAAEGMAPDGRPRVHPESRAAWRDWLEANHARPQGVWLVAWKKRTGRPRLSYEDVIEEALCFGWVDSKAGRLDDDREMIWMSPRRKGGTWARTNKERVERLEREGLMTDAGRRVIETAKADGSWTLLDSVDAMLVPDDLTAALAERPGAREHWDGFPPSARRMLLWWVVSAKRPETRARRVKEIAERAERGERAGPGGAVQPPGH
jgi:uncharacterized protein YdeI (YjbR/CyaY-like superfamily)/molybdopterin converting factor small subunit